jgi:hypothetical protein
MALVMVKKVKIARIDLFLKLERKGPDLYKIILCWYNHGVLLYGTMQKGWDREFFTYSVHLVLKFQNGQF